MSRRPDAKTVKISEVALNLLKHVKEDILKENSYSQSIILMHNDLEKHAKNKKIEIDENDNEVKDKTIVLSREAHVILNNIKYEHDLKTISNAIEFICKLWESNR